MAQLVNKGSHSVLNRHSVSCQVSAWGPIYQAGTLLAVDALFILTASVFLSSGSHFGRQRYGLTMPYPGTIPQDLASCTIRALLYFQLCLSLAPTRRIVLGNSELACAIISVMFCSTCQVPWAAWQC